MELLEWKYDKVKSIPAKEGFYILYLKREIPKIYKNDPMGILYIGKSKNLQRRLKIIDANEDWETDYEKNNRKMFNHSTLTFAVDFDTRHNLVPHSPLIDEGVIHNTDKLHLKYCVSKSHEEDEKKLLNAHTMLFGQLPPFNSQGSSLKDVWNAENSIWNESIDFFKMVCRLL